LQLNELLEEFLESLPFGVIVFDENQNIMYRNQLLGRLLNYPEELFNKQIFNFADIIRLNFDRGDYPGQNYEDVLSNFVNMMKNKQSTRFERLQSDGLHLEIQGMPISSGTLLTYTDITERKQSEQLLWQKANFDELTGLPNRSMFLDRLKYELSKNPRDNQHLILLFMDLDGFKPINDKYGHEAGDVILKTVATRWQAVTRKSETIARIGGDEFAAIIVSKDPLNSSSVLAQKYIDALIPEITVFPTIACNVGVSIGISIYHDGEGIETLLNAADRAMYESKQKGRNTYSYSNA